MKAVLNNDIIVNFHPEGSVYVEIPRGIGLERIRVVGGRVIDLLTLNEFWVENDNGVWILHAMQVPGSQLVVMSYADRKNLYDDKGTFKVKTAQEIQIEKDEKTDTMTDNRNLKAELKEMVSNLKFGQVDQHIDNVFGQLNTGQKASLKKLYKTVLFLAKKETRG